jgi:molybdate transport system regulatory protein
MARVRLRVYLGGDDAHSLGPGKIALLEAVRELGSISAAARSMGMAYRHAWELVEDMNACFARPVLATATGGRAGGGAQLTTFGEQVVRRFRAMEEATRAAIRSDLAALESETAGARPAPAASRRRARRGAAR